MGEEEVYSSCTAIDKQQNIDILRYKVLILMTKQINPLTKTLSQFQASLQNSKSPHQDLMFLSGFQ